MLQVVVTTDECQTGLCRKLLIEFEVLLFSLSVCITVRYEINAILHKISGLVPSMKEVGDNQANCTDVNMAILVTAHHTVDRTDIGTGAAAYAPQNL